MVESDGPRFMALLRWLCDRFKADGRTRPLPVGEDLAEYFAALKDLPIEDLEGGSRWHFGHSEFYPDRPAALRKSCEAWRTANPRPKEGKREIVDVVKRPDDWVDPRKFDEFLLELDGWSMAEKFGESSRDERGHLRVVR